MAIIIVFNSFYIHNTYCSKITIRIVEDILIYGMEWQIFLVKDRGKGPLHQRTGDRPGEERSRLRCAFVEGT
jgi:hypothetical protein